jgi:Cytochrome B561
MLRRMQRILWITHEHQIRPLADFSHWLTFVLVATAYCTMEFRGLATRGSWQGFAMIIGHFSAGSCVLVLMLSRVMLRFRHRSPAIVPKPPHWQTGLAHLMHLAIYLFFIVLPILGILSTLLYGSHLVDFRHSDAGEQRSRSGFC